MTCLTKKELQRFVESDNADQAIGDAYIVTRQAIQQLRKKWDIVARISKNPARNEKMRAMRAKGVSGARIAEKFGLATSHTYRILAK